MPCRFHKIRPAFQDIQDTLVLSDSPWIEQSPTASVKVLWVGRESGCWASLHHRKKGHAARPHKHLSGAHAYVISGKLQGGLECPKRTFGASSRCINVANYPCKY
jgi:hypothetical protein